MAKKPATTAPDPDLLTSDAVENEAAQAFLRLVQSMPSDAHLRITLYRHPHQYTPHVMKRESLAPPTPGADLDDMVEEIRRRYGAGHYELYVSYQDPMTKKKRMVHPSFILAPDPSAGLTEPGAPAPGPGDEIQAILDRIAASVDVQTRAREIAALQSLMEKKDGGPAPAPMGADPVQMFVQMVTALKAVMPPQVDPLTALKTAKDFLAPASGDPVNTLSLVEKLGDILVKFGGGGGSSEVRESFWGFATEALRQIGPSLPQVLEIASQVLRQGPRPVMPAPPVSVAPSPTLPPQAPEAVLPPPPGDVSWPDLMGAVGNDPAKAARLRTLLDMVLLEIQTPAVVWPDGFDRVSEVAETHLPGFLGSVIPLGADRLWDVWSRWDPRVLHYPDAGAWVRGFYAFAATPPEEEKPTQEGPDHGA